ncbi:sigma-54-dependent transcriptional regulator [Thalassoroseus pseudoceratinae]|uniref:sigma-54-dependent transcriptional regulator n=1 Tax=Thalassoroseus pseudoceratinae TaxID=2713176 RepID=UPI001423FCBB|nr:sigma-54 dependent transcriptional regulator [Thalassoroseus pseudoceratinae]
MNDHPPARILVADDEPLYLRTTGDLLRKSGFDCVCVSDAHAAMEALSKEPFDLVLSDLNMPGNLKLELLHRGREFWPDVPMIVVTGVPSLPSAIESVRLGIADYLLKPVKYEDLLASIRRVLAHSIEESEAGASARSRLEDDEIFALFPEIVSGSEPMRQVLEVISRVAHTDTNVLISGESGTGKEVVAKAIHQHSRRSSHPFQVVDCTAIPESLFESVMFGHAKGAFTGAVQDQDGLLKQCDQGTAFIDELGELPLASQAKLLRAVQDQAFTPVGKSQLVRVDTRFVCATNRDLEVEIQAERFRQDLFYRLAVIHIDLPPLRERGSDAILLAESFLRQFQRPSEQVVGLSDEVAECFLKYEWPGNIRELRNVVERAMALANSDTIQLTDLPKPLLERSGKPRTVDSSFSEISREEALDAADYKYLNALLQKHGGNVSKAARQAGLSRQGMHKLLAKHAIDAADFRG